jgi:hypothetical protein
MIRRLSPALRSINAAHSRAEPDLHPVIAGSREAALHAKRILPEIASHEGRADGPCQAFAVLVTDEKKDHPVYSAALCGIEPWLLR